MTFFVRSLEFSFKKIRSKEALLAKRELRSILDYNMKKVIIKFTYDRRLGLREAYI